MQSKKMSFVEACVSTFIGYVVAIAAQLVVFPLFDIQVSLAQNFSIGAVFTAVSIARGYAVRRLFNMLGARP